MLFGLTSYQLKAQQKPYPFNVDLSLGGGLIGNRYRQQLFNLK
ncbi:MAG: hypothetical protein U5K71_09945 [Gracilimonas sp.]|nr:hypothetical protein [Gracilimonas sp.]